MPGTGVVATRPDIACTDLSPLGRGDLAFLLRRFPAPAARWEALGRQLEAVPDTLEGMLRSAWVVEAVLRSRELLVGVSPFLLFSVMLRQVLPDHRRPAERRVLNHLANLLALFARGDRLWRPLPGERRLYRHLVELAAAAAEAADPERRFRLHAHAGNYALFLTGLHGAWLEHRHRHGRRPVHPRWYADAGSGHYGEAARSVTARRLGLDDVLLRLAVRFDLYREALARMRRDWFAT